VSGRRHVAMADFARAFLLLQRLVEQAEAAERCPFCGLSFGVQRREGAVLPAHATGCPAGEASVFLAEFDA
jgi:hypothetical protein